MFKTNEKKSTQAVTHLLKKTAGKENWTKLLKILYLADRESLIEAGIPIAGTRFCNMDDGPLAIDLYGYIKSDYANSYWDKHISRENDNICLMKDPGDDELSDYDVVVLDDIWEMYKNKTPTDMIDIVCRLPERIPQEGSFTILYEEDIMRAAGVPDNVVTQVMFRNARVFVAENHFEKQTVN